MRDRYWNFIYNLIAPFYDTVHQLDKRIKYGSENVVRAEYIANFSLKPRARILETAAGTASNAQFLAPNIDYFGLDISWRMLQRAKHNLEKWGRVGELVHADGLFIPFHGTSLLFAFPC